MRTKNSNNTGRYERSPCSQKPYGVSTADRPESPNYTEVCVGPVGLEAPSTSPRVVYTTGNGFTDPSGLKRATSKRVGEGNVREVEAQYFVNAKFCGWIPLLARKQCCVSLGERCLQASSGTPFLCLDGVLVFKITALQHIAATRHLGFRTVRRHQLLVNVIVDPIAQEARMPIRKHRIDAARMATGWSGGLLCEGGDRVS